MLVYVGAYTEPDYNGKAEGISLFDFDLEMGELTPLGLAAETANPTWLTLDATGRFLYAVNELGEGGVTAFARDAESGMLTALNQAMVEHALVAGADAYIPKPVDFVTLQATLSNFVRR